MTEPTSVAEAHARLDALAERLTSRGLGEFVDFYMPHRVDGSSPLPASEIAGIRFDPEAGGFEVYVRDLGATTVLTEGATWTEAEPAFVSAVDDLVDAHRGRRR